MHHFFTPADIVQFNKFARFHNGENVFFCKTDYLPQLFNSLKNHNKPSILISGNSDIGLTDEILYSAPSCIKKWFAQGVVTKNPLVVGMPYGIENHEDCMLRGHGKGHSEAAEKIILLCSPPFCHPEKELYANYSLTTHPIRQRVYDISQGLPYITDSISQTHEESRYRSYTKYLMGILNHKMVVCPRGNAPAETHRFWEALYLGRVPIIKRSRGNSFFTELPVIALETWDKLADLDFLNSEYERVKDNPKDMLYMKYWEEKILNECK
tara:strand:+ start:349 stop:1152 length:804 start_codon:yes stop_codon:yes gene_type:complete